MRTCSRSRPAALGRVQGQRQRRGARPGGQDDLAHPPAHQLVDQHLGQRGRRVHPSTLAQRSSRSRHQACRSAGAACRSSSSGSGVTAPTGRAPATRQQGRGRHVGGQQGGGAEPAGVRQVGQRGGQRDAGGEPDGGVDGAGHDDRQAARLRHLQGPPHPGQRRHLDHDDVGGAGDRHAQRVLRLADALVGGDRDVQPGPGQLHPQGRQLLHGRAGLLGVLQVVGRERPQRGQRVLDRPRGVGVDAHLARRPEHLADGGDPVDVVAQHLAGLGHLDLRGRAAGEAGQHAGHVGGRHRRDGGVDRDPVPDRVRPARPGGLDRSGEPAGRLAVVVLGERAELAPAGRAAQQQGLADVHPAERDPHGQGDDVHLGPVEQFS